MHVLVEGKVYSSTDVPIMILFSRSELEQFKSEPNSVDIHCSYPMSWGEVRGNTWMRKNTEKISNRKREDEERLRDTREAISDQNFLHLMDAMEPDDIEVFDEEISP
jgi:hypothetical protein